MFQEGKWLPISEELLQPLAERFEQKPVSLKLPTYEVRERLILERRETNYVPYVVVGLLGLFAFLGFLAYLGRSGKR